MVHRASQSRGTRRMLGVCDALNHGKALWPWHPLHLPLLLGIIAHTLLSWAGTLSLVTPFRPRLSPFTSTTVAGFQRETEFMLAFFAEP